MKEIEEGEKERKACSKCQTLKETVERENSWREEGRETETTVTKP